MPPSIAVTDEATSDAGFACQLPLLLSYTKVYPFCLPETSMPVRSPNSVAVATCDWVVVDETTLVLPIEVETLIGVLEAFTVVAILSPKLLYH